MGNAWVSRSAGFRYTLGIMLWVACSVLPISAEERRSDSRSLSDLFGDVLSENALEICRRARQQPLESRFQTLFGHVFPPETENVRISIDFLPTNPSPPVAEKDGSAKSPLLATEAQNRLPSGGSLVSPALELVETARRLGKLEELRDEIKRRSPTGIEQIKARDAMLLLVVAATANFEQYGIQLNEFMTLVRESPITDPVRASEVVVVWHGVSQEQTRTEIRDLLLLLREQMKFDGNSHRERVKRHIFTLNHLLDEQLVQSGSTPPEQTTGESSEYWHPVSRRTAHTRGEGFPDPAWSVTPTRARHISSHDDDYLYFASPLRGNYEIEGDLTTFGYREIRLAVGTIWAGPLYDHERLSWGNFRRELPHLKLDKRFSNFGEHMHVRVVVRDGQRTTSINGRDVFTSAQGPKSDPWVAAHSPWPASGEMQNVRITGNPEIPEELDLIANPDLPGWLPYYDESAGQSGSNWNVSEQRPSTLLERLNPFADRSTPILIGRTSNAPRGSSQESLLRYHRPMLEDGTIEYEFYYKAGELEVFPAVDRLAIVFDSDRVGIHWITDGKFDTTGVDPANFHPVSNDQPIPLTPNAWNRIRLSLKGDNLEVALNEQSIFTRKLEPENLRTFGLFHYSDRTTAMIRNLRWRGEWPRELPPVNRQELADLTLEQTLDRGPELPVVFEHDFSRGLPLEKIWISGK
ncbi:MAG TPA: DUF1583 domain-containing protein, partial [Planctomycetaceae bacterium]|nr:DUF1583 domain-containing protein [Planctomycetaceae bacterium]